ncbi:hypothetical protein [Rugosimonospora africana]|uniref:Uncharacterized protein n=1 Tax=Rugosimonospora africana TaxID=556532 RepID=A0A8J3QYR0_9ACTN|nr:hypothetical protein [Rugosimonospora africana]GIH18338.1 hypothetical protein Raf01_65100 [Rugosimonospora africana]
MASHEGPAEKLAALLETLEPEDRKEITAWLLGRTARSWPLRQPLHRDLLAQREVATGLVAGEASQLVNIRLPSEAHERLRTWCNEHNFSMAAVIRGLVERFLDGQERAAGH